MRRLTPRHWAVAAVVLPVLLLLGWVVLHSGPLAPVAVTEAPVTEQALQPALFGIGTVQAQRSYSIGPTTPGRLQTLLVDVGDSVSAGQLLGQMDAIDLGQRQQAQQAQLLRAQAQLREAQARQAFAQQQARRYAELAQAQATTDELLHSKQQEAAVAQAALAASGQELERARADSAALQVQLQHLHLVAPAAALVAARVLEPGSTVIAGQAVLELIDPHSVWVDVRLDQIHAQGLVKGLPAQIYLHSAPDQPLAGQVVRVEPKADAVTEEMRAKVAFATLPQPLPPLGELAEVQISLPPLASGPSIPNAAIQWQHGKRGVWVREGSGVRFQPITTSRSDLNGQVQVLQGLKAGEQVIVHSAQPLGPRSRVQVQERLTPTNRQDQP